MFYPELLQISNRYNFVGDELLIEIDKWLAYMPKEQQDKISVGKFATKFNMDYSISLRLLEQMCEIDILERRLIIRCNECGNVLAYTNEKDFYDDLLSVLSHNVCYNCSGELKINIEDVETIYKIKRKPTNSPDKIEKELDKTFGEIKPTTNIKELMEKANYDINNLFYDPTDEEYKRLETLFCGINSAKGKCEKGKSLERFVEYLLNLVKVFSATKEGKTTTNQLDTFAVNKLSSITDESEVLRKIGHTFICECKNENDPPKNGYFCKLASVLAMSRTKGYEHKFGIFFSVKRVPSTFKEMAEKTYYKDNISIITFCIDELIEIVYDKKNLLSYIDYKLVELQEGIIDKKGCTSVKDCFLN